MEQALIERIYQNRPKASIPRTESTPMRSGDVLRLFLRFDTGRATTRDRDLWRFEKGWTIETFIVTNRISIGEPEDGEVEP